MLASADEGERQRFPLQQLWTTYKIYLTTINMSTYRSTALLLISLTASAAFSVLPIQRHGSTSTQLNMGLFDGVREAFSAPALERSTLDAERETPIDRWMGWSVASENSKARSDAQGMFAQRLQCSVGFSCVGASLSFGVVTSYSPHICDSSC